MTSTITPIPEGKYLDMANGYRVHYHEAGPADGQPVIFLHGSGSGASGYSNFKGNYPEFAKAGFRCFVPDILGYGLSSKPDLEISVPVEVGVSYSSDLEKVEKIVLEVAADVLQTVEGAVSTWAPVVRFHTFGPYSVNFSVGLRVTEFTFQYSVKHEFVKRLHNRFKQEGIEIPYPVTTVQLKKEA